MPTVLPTCAGCRAELPPTAAFCPGCGMPAGTPYSTETRRAESRGRRDPAGDSRARLQRALGEAWEVRWLVGRGGFAEVYAAWDTQLKRQVAIKTLRQELAASEVTRERFRREAEMVAQLRHPHVVPIYAVGEAEGLVYLVMPLIEGESLAAALKREHALPVADAARVLQEAAGALHAAHRAGVVHRDVKPENLMLEGADRRVVVMDFGIAKIADAVDMKLTNTGFVMGSPQFMSPEQAAGERDVDHRTDQYALAAVAFEMLTGRMPFEADSHQGYLYQQATQRAPRVDAIRPDVPPALADALARALERDPGHRFASMEAFAQAIGASVLRTTPNGVRRRRPDRAARQAAARTRLQRWRLPAVVAALVGAVLVAAFGGAVTPAEGVRAASMREPWAGAARAALAAAGAPAGMAMRTELVQNDSVLRWLAGALGPGPAAARAARDGVGWGWRVTGYDRGRGEIWQATVSTGGRVVALERQVPESTSLGTRLAPADAAALAERALVERGWRAATLRPVAVRLPRGDHELAWHVPGSAVRNAAGDSAVRRVTVRVRGAQVVSYRESVELPAAAPGAWRDAKSGAIVGLGLVLFAIATAVAVRRTRIDDVQWGVGLRLAVPAGITLLALFGRALYHDAVAPTTLADVQGWSSEAIGFVAAAPAMLLVVAGALAAAESLSHERLPQLFAGSLDVVRGRFDAPELALGVVMGSAIGVLGAGAEAAAHRATLAGGDWMGAVPDAFELGAPPVALLYGVLAGTMFVTAIAVTLGATTTRRRSPWVAIGAVAVTSALSVLPVDHAFGAALVVAWTTGLAALVWRAGVHAGMAAMFVYYGLPTALALLRADTPAFALWGAVSLVVVLAPALLALASARRFAR